MDVFRAIIITHMEHQNRIKSLDNKPWLLHLEAVKRDKSTLQRVRMLLKTLWAKRPHVDATQPLNIPGKRETATNRSV